jgi:hypothetical protein
MAADAVETALRVGIRNFMARTAAIKDNLVAEQVQFAEALDLYQRLTSFRETNPNALWHHRMSLDGPICAICGKPLRTPEASFCAACGARRTP